MPRGSSPRLRGTRLPAAPIRLQLRFIPAPAGNTSSGKAFARCPPVHPRACGEHFTVRPELPRYLGSSPRMRGTPFLQMQIAGRQRFIPAPAGNTPHRARVACRPPVHPRACGEHLSAEFLILAPTGSSPRLRGTLVEAVDPLLGRRFIPAPAGNTRLAFVRTQPGTVHPRACGEHLQRDGRRGIGVGSSPRLRGTHIKRFRAMTVQRFIPAPAGNTAARPW